MLITPAQLVDEPLPLDESIPPGAIDYTPDLRQTGPLAVAGRAELILEYGHDPQGPRSIVEDIRLRVHLDGPFEMSCARCLDPVAQHLTADVDLIFRPEDVDADPAERAITEDETEIGYYSDSGLLLEDAVREQVLLTLPARALCQPDCQGLCPHCGANRNLTSCSCSEKPADIRWNALAALAVSDKA